MILYNIVLAIMKYLLIFYYFYFFCIRILDNIAHMDQCVKQVICYTLYLFLIMCFSLLMTKGKGNNHEKQDKASKITKTEERK